MAKNAFDRLSDQLSRLGREMSRTFDHVEEVFDEALRTSELSDDGPLFVIRVSTPDCGDQWIGYDPIGPLSCSQSKEKPTGLRGWRMKAQAEAVRRCLSKVHTAMYSRPAAFKVVEMAKKRK